MRTLLLGILFISFLCGLNAQTREDIRESFNEGEYFFVRGDFSEAAFYFRMVVDSYPNNAHFNFKLGECYMNIPGSEAFAIPCFEKAYSPNGLLRTKYRNKGHRRKQCPIACLVFIWAMFYRINNRLDDALKAYDTFINSPFYYGKYNVNVVENEIKSCERAKNTFSTHLLM